MIPQFLVTLLTNPHPAMSNLTSYGFPSLETFMPEDEGIGHLHRAPST